jgi:hypothetical protein
MTDKKQNKAYYECKKCFYKCEKKIDMRKHLNKKNFCERKPESYKYDESELITLSLNKMYENNNIMNNINNDIDNDIDNDINNILCKDCKKKFSSKKTLKYHQINTCKFKNYNNSKNEEQNNNEENNNNENNNNENNKNNNEENNNHENNNDENNESIFNNVTINNVNFHIKNSYSNYYNKKNLIYVLKNLNLKENLENVLENEMHRTNQLFNNNLLKDIDIKNIVKKSMEDLDVQLSNFIKELESS